MINTRITPMAIPLIAEVDYKYMRDILEDDQLRYDTADALMNDTLRKAYEEKWYDQDARNVVLRDLESKIGNIYDKTPDLSKNYSKVLNTVAKARESPYFNINSRVLEQKAIRDAELNKLGAEAIDESNGFDTPLYNINPQTNEIEWVNPNNIVANVYKSSDYEKVGIDLLSGLQADAYESAMNQVKRDGSSAGYLQSDVVTQLTDKKIRQMAYSPEVIAAFKTSAPTWNKMNKGGIRFKSDKEIGDYIYGLHKAKSFSKSQHQTMNDPTYFNKEEFDYKLNGELDKINAKNGKSKKPNGNPSNKELDESTLFDVKLDDNHPLNRSSIRTDNFSKIQEGAKEGNDFFSDETFINTDWFGSDLNKKTYNYVIENKSRSNALRGLSNQQAFDAMNKYAHGKKSYTVITIDPTSFSTDANYELFGKDFERSVDNGDIYDDKLNSKEPPKSNYELSPQGIMFTETGVFAKAAMETNERTYGGGKKRENVYIKLSRNTQMKMAPATEVLEIKNNRNYDIGLHFTNYGLLVKKDINANGNCITNVATNYGLSLNTELTTAEIAKGNEILAKITTLSRTNPNEASKLLNKNEKYINITADKVYNSEEFAIALFSKITSNTNNVNDNSASDLDEE